MQPFEGTRLCIFLLFRLDTTLLTYLVLNVSLVESKISTASKTMSSLLLVGYVFSLGLPFSFALAFLLSLLLDKKHLAELCGLWLSLNNVNIPLFLMSLLSTLWLLLRPPRRFSSPPIYFHSQGHSLGRL